MPGRPWTQVVLVTGGRQPAGRGAVAGARTRVPAERAQDAARSAARSRRLPARPAYGRTSPMPTPPGMDEIERMAERIWPGRWVVVTEDRLARRRARHRAAIAWRDGRIPLEVFGASRPGALRMLLAALRQIDAERPVGAVTRGSRAGSRHGQRPAA